MSEQLTAYCMKCKEKKPITEAKAVFTESGTPATRGVCPECGANLYRMGKTHQHEGLTPPEPVKRKKKTSRGKVKVKASTGAKKRRGKLVIVESPAKAKTIENYLGKEYRVKASVGHIRDLLKSRLSVDVENDFEPEYRVPNDKRDVVKDLKAAAEGAQEIYLATDPDREGEAIAWHLMEAIDSDPERTHRVVFYEVTKNAVQEAFIKPRQIDMNLVNAQQTRRILDRLVGYELSPMLWKKVRPRLSAGRVQSVAVRFIVDREREIDAFIPDEYWTIDAELARNADGNDPDRQSFMARLFKISDQDVTIGSETEANAILAELAEATYTVRDVIRGQRKRNPYAPFTTSTLQQDASRRLGFTAQKTMRVAQQLYEGVDIGNGGAVGLITYIRTDSRNVSKEAQTEARKYIAGRFGSEYVPARPNFYGRKSKNAQEAHEAVRPTGVSRSPDKIKSRLSRDQYRLYQLIWNRFIASQMEAAVYDTLRVEIAAGDEITPLDQRKYLFKSAGSVLTFAGFLAVYGDTSVEDDPDGEGLNLIFPEMTHGDLLDLLKLLPEQHFTQPPPRYTEASLVKTLEEYGVGRPSTYAPIMETIQNRGYVEREGKALHPTDIGMIVNDLLVENFKDIVDYNFTAAMEDRLDSIADGEEEWVPVLEDFYTPFKKEVEWAFEHVPNVELENEEVGRDCPDCGSPLIIRWGRYGKFIGCSNFPECRYTEQWVEKTGIRCPRCEDGEVIERKTKRGRTFYGCSNYPACEFTSWKKPMKAQCPHCGGPLIRQGKYAAKCLDCQIETKLADLKKAGPAER